MIAKQVVELIQPLLKNPRRIITGHDGRVYLYVGEEDSGDILILNANDCFWTWDAQSVHLMDKNRSK